MFSKLLVSVCMSVMTVFGAYDVSHNEGSTRYFVGYFNSQLFPLAIDECIPTGIVGTAVQMATCESDDTVRLVQYVDACNSSDADQITSDVTYNMTSMTGEGTEYDFNCDSDNDNVAIVDFRLSPCESAGTNVRFWGAVGVCVYSFGSAGPLSLEMYCDDDLVQLQYYNTYGAEDSSGDCSDDSEVYNVANTTTECEWMLETGGFDVYGSLGGCSVDDGDSAASLSCGIIIAVGAILAFLQ